MTDIFHIPLLYGKAASLITADIYMLRTDKKGSVKTANLGLRIGSYLVASGDLKLNRPTKI